jgi:phage-related protein
MAINLPIVSKFEDKGVKQAEGAFGGLGKTLGKLGGLIAATFSVTAITNFAKESLAAAEGVQVANQRLDQIASSMGIFGAETQAVTERLKAYAEANELNLGTDAEVIKATQAKLLAFKGLAASADEAGGAFDRTTRASLDLAAAGFGTAEGNAVKLARALEDPTKGLAGLARMGVVFTDAEKEKVKALVESGNALEAQNLILAAVETRVGGTAEATATASEKMALAFDNVKETVGAALLPVFEQLSLSLLPLIESIAPMLAEIFTALIPVFDEVGKIIPDLIKGFMPLLSVFTDIIVVVARLAIQLLPIFVSILNAILPIIAAILPVLATFLEDLITPLAPAILEIVEGFMPLIDALLPAFVQLLRTLLPVITQLLLDVFVPLAPAIISVVEAITPLLLTILPPLIDLINTLLIPALEFATAVFAAIVENGINVLQSGLSSLSAFLTPFAEGFKSVWRDISGFVKSTINGILGFIQGLVNGVVDGVNSVIGALNTIKVDIPSWIPMFGGQSFSLNLPRVARISIPRLAEGGIVMPQPGGVLANIAEAGRPEAVIPLDRLGNMGTTNNTYNINVNAGMGADGSQIGRQIVDEILKFERSSGRVFARA